MKFLTLASAVLTTFSFAALADDWPQWHGPQRDGVWRESGILEKFPPGGPKVLWRTPVNRGYAGPSVVADRVYLMDRKALDTREARAQAARSGNKPGNERLLCLDATTGKILWEQSYDCPYTMAYSAGPRVTPIVDGDRVYTFGGEGNLICRATKDGAEKWSHDFKDFFCSDHSDLGVRRCSSHPWRSYHLPRKWGGQHRGGLQQANRQGSLALRFR